MNFAFDTNTKLNIILAILAIILVLAMILVFRKTGEGYAVTCPNSNAACDATKCEICKANQNNPDYYCKGGCAVCA